MKIDLDAKMQVQLLLGCVEDGDRQAVRKLLSMGFPTNHPDVKKTPLNTALHLRHNEIVGALLDAGAPFPEDKQRRTLAIVIGLRMGVVSVLERAREAGYLEESFDDLFARAADEKREALALRLLELGANPLSPSPSYDHKGSPSGFELAARWCSPQLMAAMLHRFTESEKDDLLVSMVRVDQPRAVSALLAAGANANQTIEGRSLLQLAPRDAEDVKRLLRSVETGETIELAMGADNEPQPTTPARNALVL